MPGLMPPRRIVVPNIEHPPEPPVDPIVTEDDDSPSDPMGDLAFLTDASDDIEWSVERFKTAQEIASDGSRGKARVWVTKLVGKVDLAAFAREQGGGLFRFYGKLPGGAYYASKEVELAGPRKDYNAPAPSPNPSVTVATPTAAPVDPEALRQRRFLRRLYRKIEALELRATATPAHAPAPAMPTDLNLIFGLADRINQRAVPSEGPVEKIADALMKGIEIGSGREGPAADGGNEWVPIIKEVIPVLRDLIGTFAAAARARNARPGGAPGRPAAAPRPPREAEATVETVNPEPRAAEPQDPPAPAPPANGDSHRLQVAIESLARAIARGDDPQDFAATLEGILNEQELFFLAQGTPDELMAQLGTYAERFPVFKNDRTRGFVTALLAELANPERPEGE